MRWFIVLGFVLALLPVGASAQSTNCSTYSSGSTAQTNCSTIPALPPPPPAGYHYPDSFFRKIKCLTDALASNFKNGMNCPIFAYDDFRLIPDEPHRPPSPAPVTPVADVKPPAPGDPSLCVFQLGFRALS